MSTINDPTVSPRAMQINATSGNAMPRAGTSTSTFARNPNSAPAKKLSNTMLAMAIASHPDAIRNFLDFVCLNKCLCCK
jgi:hypothetical protein